MVDMNLKQLEQEREIASIDQMRLFDFYEEHWQSLIDEINLLRKEVKKFKDTNDLLFSYKDTIEEDL
jgi:FtsZ-binding cell division protein ZapB